MGLFGGKELCAICGSKAGGLSSVKISDGFICRDCAKKCAPVSLFSLKSAGQIRQRICQRTENFDKYQLFSPTASVPNHLEIDSVNKLWCIPALDKKNPQLFSFSDLIDYELVEDGVSVTKGGLGKKQKDIITSMFVAISVRDDFVSRLEISLIGSETKKGGLIYAGMKGIGNQIVSLLDVAFNAAQPPVSAAAPFGGSADELLKYKQLLDMDVITQAEYDAKKAQLLGL